MNAQRFYLMIYRAQFIVITVELCLGLWMVAGMQAGVACAMKSLGWED